jgi:hypothetical protein
MPKYNLSDINDKLRWYSKMEPIIKELMKFDDGDQYQFLVEVLTFLKERVQAANFFYLDMDITNVPSHNFGPDFRIVEPGPEAQTGMVKVSLFSYLNKGDADDNGNSGICCTDLRDRARKYGIGLKDGEKLLMLQDKIPEHAKKSFFIPLTATILQNMSDKELYIPCLERNSSSNNWRMGIRCLDSMLSTNGRLIRFERVNQRK